MSDTRATVLVVGGVALHVVLSIVLLFVLVGSAYAFSRTTGAEISSYDELSRLGNGASLCVLGLMVSGVTEFIVAITLLVIPATRDRAWIAPLLGICASVACVLLAVMSFHPAVPYVGG